jgi:type IV pilus assembly protein PilQ
MAFTILGNNLDLDIELSALQSEGRGEVVANPRVITANQREAVIKQGDEIGYVTVTGVGANATATVQFKEAVLELKVTPTITQDNRVFLNLGVKKDEIAGFIEVNGGNVPQITKREVTTAVLINNGQTVVVGGIYEFEKREDLSKVPFLGDIPGLGNLFRNRGRTSDKAELLVFVTPRILKVAGAGR